MTGSVKCARYKCGELMTIGTDGAGQVTYVCRGCERNQQGVCRDCPTRISDHRRFRCPSCSRTRRRARDRALSRAAFRDPERREIILARQRRRRRTPHGRKRMLESIARYEAKRGPRKLDDGDRLYKREWARRRREDPAYREQANAARRAREAERRQDPEYNAKAATEARERSAELRADPLIRAAINAKRRANRARRKAESVVGTISAPAPMERAS